MLSAPQVFFWGGGGGDEKEKNDEIECGQHTIAFCHARLTQRAGFQSSGQQSSQGTMYSYTFLFLQKHISLCRFKFFLES